MLKWFFGPILITKIDRLGTYAAALAYYFVLSMVPFLAVTFVLGIYVADRLDLGKHYAEDFVKTFNDIIPMGNQIVTEKSFEAVERSSLGGFVPIGVIVGFYTSFNLMEQIIRTLLFIFDDPRKPSEWSWVVVVKTIALLLLWMMLLLLISITAVEASFLRNMLNQFAYSNLAKALVRVAQVLIVIAALFSTFYLTYYLVPTRRYRANLIVEASLLASCGWIGCSLLLGAFMPEIMQTSAAYIALGSVVAILLWAQACAWSVIVGACWMVRFTRTKP